MVESRPRRPTKRPEEVRPTRPARHEDSRIPRCLVSWGTEIGNEGSGKVDRVGGPGLSKEEDIGSSDVESQIGFQ